MSTGPSELEATWAVMTHMHRTGKPGAMLPDVISVLSDGLTERVNCALTLRAMQSAYRWGWLERSQLGWRATDEGRKAVENEANKEES